MAAIRALDKASLPKRMQLEIKVDLVIFGAGSVVAARRRARHRTSMRRDSRKHVDWASEGQKIPRPTGRHHWGGFYEACRTRWQQRL